MYRILLASLLALAMLPGSAQADAEWGKIPREELFAPHSPQWPDADAVVLYNHGIARVDSKDRLKFRQHKRIKIYKPGGLDRAVVRIPYLEGDDIKDFRAQTIIPPGNIVEVKDDHRHVEENGRERVLVVEFPSVQPGAVLEYEYELRRDEIHTVPAWPFRERDPVKVSVFELQVPDGLTYDASFSWTPSIPPAPVKKKITNPEDTRLELNQVRWELKNQPAACALPLADEPGRWDMTLYPQFTKFQSTYKNAAVVRPWGDVATKAAGVHEAFLKKADGLKEWTGDVPGDGRTVAQALYARVRDGLVTDPNGPTLAGSTAADVVREGRGTAAAKNVLLASMLKDRGLPADVVRVRAASQGPVPERYHAIGPYGHAIVRLTLDGETIWADASVPGCPFGVLPPEAHVTSGILVRAQGGDLVPVTVTQLPSHRNLETVASVDAGGVLRATSTVRYEGWEALLARSVADRDGGSALAESVVTSRYGDAAVVESFEMTALEDPAEPLGLSVTYRVPGYARVDGDSCTLRTPFLSALTGNPLPEGKRLVPVRFGFPGETEEKMEFTAPDGWVVATAPRAGVARTADLRYKASHESAGAVLNSTRTVDVREAELIPDAAEELRGTFVKIVTADASEVVLKRASRSSSAR
jgi:transglutaminase-like putative cysteine protease